MNIQQLEKLLIDNNQHWRGVFPSALVSTHKRSMFDRLYQELRTNRLISIIFGPRRIGKSYLLLQLIHQLLLDTEPTNPRQTLYFPFTSQHNEEGFITQLLDVYISKYAQKGQKMFIFFDEVQYIDYWQDQIKSYYDRTDIEIKFVLTGSVSLFYKQKSKESLLGRINKHPLFGLSFLEYLSFKGKEISITSQLDLIANLTLFRSEFKHYLAYGQFPELVLNSNINPHQYLQTVADQLINVDVPYLHQKLDRPLLYNLIKTLANETAQSMSVNKLAVGFDVKRYEIATLVKILEELYIIGTCTNGYYRKMRAKLSASKKVYITSTNLALALNGFDHSYLNDNYVFGHYAENYAYVRLLEQQISPLEYYNDGKSEVDFVSGNTMWEVKSGQIKDEEKYRRIANMLNKKLIIITESVYEPEGSPIKIPIYIL